MNNGGRLGAKHKMKLTQKSTKRNQNTIMTATPTGHQNKAKKTTVKRKGRKMERKNSGGFHYCHRDEKKTQNDKTSRAE